MDEHSLFDRYVVPLSCTHPQREIHVNGRSVLGISNDRLEAAMPFGADSDT